MKKGVILMCLLEGQKLAPYMPGYCTEHCVLYLSTCIPWIENGLLTGCECTGDDYCCECPYFEDCGK